MEFTLAVRLKKGGTMFIPKIQAEAGGIEWQMRYGDPVKCRFISASLLSSYEYLLSQHITTKSAIEKLREMRKAYKEQRCDLEKGLNK